MFISPAYAQSVGFLDDTSSLMQMAPLVLIFVVFYFFLIRPQQTKAKQHRTMLEALRRGDRVVTGGGIIGTVTKVQNDRGSDGRYRRQRAGAGAAQHDHQRARQDRAGRGQGGGQGRGEGRRRPPPPMRGPRIRS